VRGIPPFFKGNPQKRGVRFTVKGKARKRVLGTIYWYVPSVPSKVKAFHRGVLTQHRGRCKNRTEGKRVEAVKLALFT